MRRPYLSQCNVSYDYYVCCLAVCTAAIHPDLSVRSSRLAFECTWRSLLWTPDRIKGDAAFDNEELRLYATKMDSVFQVNPPSRLHKNQVQ